MIVNSFITYLFLFASDQAYVIMDKQAGKGKECVQVSNPELIWLGQSRSSTKQPATNQINTFSKKVIGDIRKNNLFVK